MTRATLPRLVIVLALALLAPLARSAAPVTVQVNVDSDQVYAGDPFRLQIIVNGAQSAEAPDISHVKGLRLDFMGGTDVSSSNMTIDVNGRRRVHQTRQYLLEYNATAFAAGTLEIPPITVVVDGKPYASAPVTINVLRPAETDDFKTVISIDKERLYVGEPARLRVVWYIGMRARRVSISLPQDPSEVEALDGVAPSSGREMREIEVNGRTIIAALGEAELDDRRYATLTFEQTIVPRKVGRIELGPMTIACEGIVGERSPRSFFDSPFVDRAVTKRFVSQSNTLALDVRPLPEAGRPAGFGGHVGQFAIRAAAQPTTVNVGDPITLTVRVTGPPSSDLIPDLALERQADLTAGFRIAPAEGDDRTVDRGAKTFTRTIRAQSESVKQIPAITFPYFDPVSGSYKMAASAPIPLVVRPTREVTSVDAIGGSAEILGSAVETAAGGLAHNYETAAALASQSFELVEAIRSPLGAALLGAPVGVYLVAGGLALVRRARLADGGDRRRRRALASARRALAHEGDGADGGAAAAAVSRAVCGYAAAKLDHGGAGLTPGECARMLAERGIPEAEDVRALLERCDSARFAGLGREQAGALRDEALHLVGRLERSLRRVR